MSDMTPLDCYRYTAQCRLAGQEFAHGGTVYAENSWDAAELAEAEVRAAFPGVRLKGDDPAHGITSSPQVFVTRDLVNRAVAAGRRDALGNLLREEIPEGLRADTPASTTIERKTPP